MGDVQGGARSARAGTRASDPKTGIRRRAVGTRDRIISYLGQVTDISDPGGMASTKLAEAVGYPGSSVAFAQLLSGMERDGLIAREVRGKRTYRIILAPGVQPGRARSAGAPAASGAGNLATTGAVGRLGAADDHIPAIIGLPEQQPAAQFDYDELARRLLIHVIRRLATPPDGAESVVADLERELAAARSRATSLTAENLALREQLAVVRRNLDAARASLDSEADSAEVGLPRTGPVGDELTEADIVVLGRLLAQSVNDDLDGGIEQGATAS